MSDLRSKYRATDAKLLKKKVQEEDAEFSSGRGTFLQILDGKNRIRFFPSHNPKENFYTLRAFYWVKNYSDDDSGDELYNRTVLNSKFHYPDCKLDLIDEYVSSARTHIENNEDLEPAEKAAKLDVFNNWKTGINLNRGWVAYALKINGEKREFGLIELNKTLRDKINAEVMLEDDDDPIEVDPYTDPDEGKIVTIFFDKSKGKADQRYNIKVGKADQLSDDELEVFDRSKPLTELFLYTQKDWDAGLEGLKIFDDQNDIGLFEDQDWIERVEEIREQFKFGSSSTKKQQNSDDDDEDEKPSKKKMPKPVEKPKQTAKKIVVEEDDEEDEDDSEDEAPVVRRPVDKFEPMDREELKAWIVEEHAENEDAVEVLRVKKSMSDEDIRVMIREYLSSKSDSVDSGEESEDEDEDDEPEVEVKKAAPAPKNKVPTKDNASDDSVRLSAVQQRLKALKESKK